MQPKFTATSGFNVYLRVGGMYVKERAESAVGQDKSGSLCLALNSSRHCWNSGQQAHNISACSSLGSSRLKARYLEERQCPLLNNHWGKVGVVLQLVVVVEGSSSVFCIDCAGCVKGWTGRRAAGVGCLDSICCSRGSGLCWDVVSSTLNGICSWIILAGVETLELRCVSMSSVCACWVALLQSLLPEYKDRFIVEEC
eukprot:1142292-Pelagomonas_calceolata.AAC.1